MNLGFPISKILYSIIVSLMTILIISCVSFFFSKKAKNKFLDRVTVFAFYITAVSPIIVYLILLYLKFYQSKTFEIIGNTEGWLLFFGAVFGGFITLLAVILTMRAEHDIKDKELKVKNEEIENEKKKYSDIMIAQKIDSDIKLLPIIKLVPISRQIDASVNRDPHLRILEDLENIENGPILNDSISLENISSNVARDVTIEELFIEYTSEGTLKNVKLTPFRLPSVSNDFIFSGQNEQLYLKLSSQCIEKLALEQLNTLLKISIVISYQAIVPNKKYNTTLLISAELRTHHGENYIKYIGFNTAYDLIN